MYRQTFTMADTLVATNFDFALDVLLYIATKVAFYN